MAQAKKKTATRTAKKTTKQCCSKKCASKKRFCYEKYDRNQKSNLVFVISMSILAATLLFANLLFITA